MESLKACSSTHRNTASDQSLTEIGLINKILCYHNMILKTHYCCENISSHCEHPLLLSITKSFGELFFFGGGGGREG